MSVKITGTNELIVELEEKLGRSAMEAIAKQAIGEGAEIVKKEINSSIAAAGNKGYAKGWTVADTTIDPVEIVGGIAKGKIHWAGSHGRHRIIHFNEWGTVKNPNPPRKGAIARAMRTSKEPYKQKIKTVIESGL